GQRPVAGRAALRVDQHPLDVLAPPGVHVGRVGAAARLVDRLAVLLVPDVAGARPALRRLVLALLLDLRHETTPASSWRTRWPAAYMPGVSGSTPCWRIWNRRPASRPTASGVFSGSGMSRARISA